MGRASPQCSRAWVKDSIAWRAINHFVVEKISLVSALLLRISVVLNIKFPRQIGVFATKGMKGGDLVLVGLVRSTCFKDENAVTSLCQIHRYRPATGAGPDNNKIIFVICTTLHAHCENIKPCVISFTAQMWAAE
jgi:hypothetical protein